MIDQFNAFIESNALLIKTDKVLLAVSGGVDSVVMTWLFRESGYAIGIAHCNFQLRGAASDGDEEFVRDLAAQWGIPFHNTTFATEQIAARKGQSHQITARELRYEWLEKVRQQEAYQYIATAHHLNDAVETALYNFTKGCGIRGLHGIPVKNGAVIRPLLFAEKTEILSLALEHGLTYREDASNLEDKYDRNKIRLRVIPQLERLNPSFIQTAAANMNRLQEVEYLFDQQIHQLRSSLMKQEGKATIIQLKELLIHPAGNTILYEFLTPYGFPSDTARQVLSQERQPGALFFSPGYRLLVDRDRLILEPHAETPEVRCYVVEQNTTALTFPQGSLRLAISENLPESFSPNPNIARLDAGLLHFPLRLRLWQDGDTFCPLGLKGQHQKIKKFLISKKLTRFEKEKVWILETAHENICWIIGHRIDERFKVSETTKQVLTVIFDPVLNSLKNFNT